MTFEDPGRDCRAREGLDAVTYLLMGKFVKRWGFILAVTLVIGLVEPSLMPLFYGALAFSAVVLLMILGTRRAIANKLAAGRSAVIDVEAEEIEDDPTLIDVTPQREDER
ncbi:hypothetical protein WJT74_04240 [Sphingomicrobium sp. XHP0239]|uniref:hypothetical protein n=1 Tax=Sphingomicrobium maritimum TaxID=3133972 RepID=UPI0031CC6E21